MAKTSTNLRDVSKILEKSAKPFQDPPLVAAPFTEITGLDGQPRKLPDPSKTLKPAFGIERIMLKNAVLDNSLKGPNGEVVYKESGDLEPRIKAVGPWTSSSLTFGNFWQLPTSFEGFIEVTFYGTGLNYLTIPAGNSDLRITIDGGVESSDILTENYSTVLYSRNYSAPSPINLVSGLPLGLHTVKLRQASGASVVVYGFEILNEEADIQVPEGEAFSGGHRVAQNALATTPYNSGFDGSPTLNGRGGRVLMYKEPGSNEIKKAIQQVDSSQGNLNAADHSNEEVYRRINFREFGANRSDDFSTLGATASDRAFTLDDGTTTLVANDGRVNQDGVFPNNAGAFITLTFVGTGLDIVYGIMSDVSVNHEIFIDGQSISVNGLNGDSEQTTRKIVSGLPYGTHTFKLQSNGTGFQPVIKDFIIYQPKKPEIPQDAEVIADYNLMADFVVRTGGDETNISQGVLKKVNSREAVFVEGTGGTTNWRFLAVAVVSSSGFQIDGDRLNASVEWTFFGSGAEIRYSSAANHTSSAILEIDDGSGFQAVTAANFPTANIDAIDGATIDASGNINQRNGNGNEVGISVSGLPLGVYKIRLKNNNSGTSNFLITRSIDIITPIHYPNTKVGSLALGGDIPVLQESEESKVDLSKAKAWLSFDFTTNTVNNSFNVASVLDVGVGQMVINFERPFKNDPIVLGMGDGSSSDVLFTAPNLVKVSDGNGLVRDEKPRSSIRVDFKIVNGSTDVVTRYDGNYVCVVVFGELEGEGE